MNDGQQESAPQNAKRPMRVVWILALGLLFLIAAALIQTRLADFANRDIDPSALPRPKLDAPFITSADEVVDKMIELGEITDQDMVYDLGCGDGRIVITAALQRGCRGVGIDKDPERVAEATENARLHGVESLVTIRQEDIFNVDLREANVIVMYLLPWMVRDLVPQFEQCRPGTRIVSHDWKIEGIQEEKTVKVPVSPTSEHFVFLYITPLKKLPPTTSLKQIVK